jgi:transcriptional regulator with XRE-family HTH domain
MKHSGSSDLRLAKRALGKRIRELRQEKGWTQAAFASMCRIDPSYVSRIEQGEMNPRCSVLQTIANKLQISIFSLLGPIA